MTDWRTSLGRPVGAEDQPPGFYRVRPGGKKKNLPIRPVRLVLTDDGLWHCLVIGDPVAGSPARDPQDIPFVRDFGPFHALSEQEYWDLIRKYEAAPAGSPLKTPDQPVDLRAARAL